MTWREISADKQRFYAPFGLKWPLPVSEMPDKDEAWPDFVASEKSGTKPRSMPRDRPLAGSLQ